jgi:hypothetical protein
MANSLMDLFSGSQQQPQDNLQQGGGISGMSNSLVGLGMGLLQPYNPWAGTNAWSNALQGYQTGAVLDQRTKQQQQQLAMEQARLKLAQQSANREPEAIRQLRAAGVPQEKWADYLYPKQDQLTEGKIVYREQEYPYLRDRAGNYTFPLGRPPGGPGAAPAPAAAPAGVPFTGNDPFGTGPSGTTAGVPAAIAATGPAPSGAVPPPLPGMENELPSVQKTVRQKQLEDYAKTQLKDPQQEAQAKQSAANVLTALDTAEKQALNKGGFLPTTGILGGKLTQVYQPSADLEATLKTIASNVSLDKLSAMRAAAPGGASGLGAVTEGEHALLQASIAAVSQSQGQEQLLANLKRVRATYDWIINRTDKNQPPPFVMSAGQQPATTGGGGGGGTTKSGIKWTVQ